MKNSKNEKKSSLDSVTEIKKLKKDLSMLKIVNSKGYLKKTHLISNKKREIAQILTEQNKLKKQNNCKN